MRRLFAAGLIALAGGLLSPPVIASASRPAPQVAAVRPAPKIAARHASKVDARAMRAVDMRPPLKGAAWSAREVAVRPALEVAMRPLPEVAARPMRAVPLWKVPREGGSVGRSTPAVGREGASAWRTVREVAGVRSPLARPTASASGRPRPSVPPTRNAPLPDPAASDAAGDMAGDMAGDTAGDTPDVVPMGGAPTVAAVAAGDIVIEDPEARGWAAGPVLAGGKVVVEGATGSTVDSRPRDLGRFFGAIRRRSSQLSRCDDSLAIDDGHIDLTSGRTNVLNLTGAQLNALGEIILDSPPTPGSPLLVNVDTSASGGVFTWDGPTFAGIEPDQAAHVLFHFPGAVELRHAGGRVPGTIYAPYARFIDSDAASIDGAVVVRALQTGTRLKKANPFSDVLRCQPPRPSPTVRPSEESEAPQALPRAQRPEPMGTLRTSPVAWFGVGLSLLGLMVLLALLATRRRSHR